MEIPNPLTFIVPIFLLAIGSEIYISRKKKLNLYQFSDLMANLGIAAGDVAFGFLSTFLYLGIFYFLYNGFSNLRFDYLGYHSLGWQWWVWIVCIFAEDLCFYWYHRFSHTIRLLWAAHVVHHSSEHFNFSTGLRNGWFTIMYKPVFWFWLAFLGFHPIMISTCMTINSVYQFFCHTQLSKSWGKLEWIFISPATHAVHHGKNPDYIDKNFAGMFILYDRIFGTFRPADPSQTIVFGVTNPPPSNILTDIVFHEFRRMKRDIAGAKTWREMLNYFFGPPGWKP